MCHPKAFGVVSVPVLPWAGRGAVAAGLLCSVQVSAGMCRDSRAGCWGGRRLAEEPCCVCIVGGAACFHHGAVWAVTPVLLSLPFPPALLAVCCYLYNHYNHLSFLSHPSGPQPPPLAGPNPVGCNPRGAPDTVNSPFTRAAELLQTFLLIFTGLKASPFSLIIP